LAVISKEMKWTDWLVIHQLGKNVDPFIFALIIKDLANLRSPQHTYSRQNSTKRVASRASSVLRTYSTDPGYSAATTTEVLNII